MSSAKSKESLLFLNLAPLSPFDIGKISTLDLLFLFGPKYVQYVFCNYHWNENKGNNPNETFSLK